MPRTEQIRIRVSAKEKAEIERVAAEERLTMSAFLRRCVIISRPPVPPPTPMKEAA